VKFTKKESLTTICKAVGESIKKNNITYNGNQKSCVRVGGAISINELAVLLYHNDVSTYETSSVF